MNSSSHLLLSGAKEGFLCHTHTCASMQTWMHTHDNTLSHTRIRTHLHCELSCLLLFLGDTWLDTGMLGVWNTGSALSWAGWGWALSWATGCGCFPALLISHDLLHVSFPLLILLQGPAERARERLWGTVTLERKLVWRKLGLDVFFWCAKASKVISLTSKTSLKGLLHNANVWHWLSDFLFWMWTEYRRHFWIHKGWHSGHYVYVFAQIFNINWYILPTKGLEYCNYLTVFTRSLLLTKTAFIWSKTQ